MFTRSDQRMGVGGEKNNNTTINEGGEEGDTIKGILCVSAGGYEYVLYGECLLCLKKDQSWE